MSMDNILSLVEQYKEAAQLIEAAQAEQEVLKAQIKEAMAERDTKSLDVGCYKVRLSDFSSTRLDSKAIKTVAPALYEQYSKTVTGQRLTIL
jgi:tRNA(Ser,Leu) C12 N-acetylase TAN1